MRKWMEWWRLSLLAVMMGAFLFVVLQSSQTGYLIVQVLLLFSVLFCGYRFGPGTGAVAGSVCGIILALVSGELTQMGILCLLGVFSGAFRGLGRMASVTAYAAAAFGVGMMYSPLVLFQTMEAVAAGGAVFLLLPAKLVTPPAVQLEREDEAAAPSFTGMAGVRSEQLQYVSQAFGSLSAMYREPGRQEAPEREESAEEDWKQRYLELRLLLSEQLQECGDILEEAVRQLEGCTEVPPQVRRSLEKQLEGIGIQADRICMAQGPGAGSSLILSLFSQTSRCISMKLVCEKISESLGRPMVPAPDQPMIVSATARCVRFEEDPAYFTLFGAAGRSKDGNDTSGDSYSYLQLPGAKSLLFLCDGMGSGDLAGRESAGVTELAEMLCRAGYMPSMIIRLINQALMIQARERPVTIDMGCIDCRTGVCEITKSGAAAAFLKRGNEAELLDSDTMPVGILSESMPMERMIKLRDGDMLIMMTDGVLEELPVLDKEEDMRRFCAGQETGNPKELAARILRYAVSKGGSRDDMTVLVAGIWRKW